MENDGHQSASKRFAGTDAIGNGAAKTVRISYFQQPVKKDAGEGELPAFTEQLVTGSDAHRRNVAAGVNGYQAKSGLFSPSRQPLQLLCLRTQIDPSAILTASVGVRLGFYLPGKRCHGR